MDGKCVELAVLVMLSLHVVIAELAAYYLYEAFLGIFHYFADTFI
jgi:hypothetical protein